MKKNYAKKVEVRRFICRLRARESHYGRSKSDRIYLPSELNSISHLWKMYNESVGAQLQVNFTMFYDTFSKEFNIGFSGPRVDVCTTCEYLKTKIKTRLKVAC